MNIIKIVIILIFVISSLIFIFNEYVIGLYNKRKWNNGICRKCGSHWILINESSKNKKTYICQNNHKTSINFKHWYNK